MTGSFDKSAASSIVLAALATRHNVLIAGPPATGKTRLLAEVADRFQRGMSPRGQAPTLMHDDDVPIQRGSDPASYTVLPSPGRANRKVFRTAFHQGSKARDFLTGIVPDLRSGATAQFRISEGILYRASEHARQAGGAALLIIDEINRGPAVQVFGGAIVAMEGDKRLSPDGKPHRQTQVFDLLDPATGAFVEYALPHDLYILGAMNQADVSVEPLDVAFLRRWAPYRLEPDDSALRAALHVAPTHVPPPSPGSPADVYAAAILAWAAVNDRIALGRGQEFRIGHGILLMDEPAKTVDAALFHVITAWQSIRAHIDEVFFGDVRGVATVLNATAGMVGHVYELAQRNFGELPSLVIEGPAAPDRETIYGMLLAVAGVDPG